MKNNILYFILVFFISGFMYSQGSTSSISSGDVFTIGKVDGNKYKHINFPRENFIIKKGGIANYKNVIGKKVVVTSIKEKNNGKLIATIKLASSKKFFNSHKFLSVDINEAISSKELIRTDK